MKRTAVYCMILALFSAQQVPSQNSLPRDNEGWTVFTPSPDSRIIYVSQDDGDDATAEYYSPDNAAVGANPFVPAGTVHPFGTIAEAFKQARDGYPDWVLFKRGEVWTGVSFSPKNGKNDDEPSLVAGYGSEGTAPQFNNSAGFRRCCKDFNNIAVSGLHFYANTRDPDSPDYAGPDGKSGFEFYVAEERTGSGLLIEGCTFRFFSNNVVQGPGILKDMVVRRCLICDNYSASAHSQGMYTNNVSLLLEENLFDHNGWYMQQIDGGNEQDSGQATMFNHNTYFCNSQGVTFRGNMFLRSSSIGTKWTANDGEGSAHDIVIDNNLFVEGELGISMGGNKTDPSYRFRNITVRDNVFTDIGRDRPTNRSLGWYIEMNDWDNGLVEGNLLLHETSDLVNNVFAMKLLGQSRNVTIRNNIMHGLSTGGDMVVLENGTEQKNITFSSNILDASGLNARLLKINEGFENYTLADNTYTSGRAEDEWFTVAGERTDLAGYVSGAGETGAQVHTPGFSDATRTPEKYNVEHGGPGTWQDFIAEVRSQSRYSWKSDYTAAAVNEWIRKGFDRERQSIRHRFITPRRALSLQGKGKAGYFTLRGRNVTGSRVISNGILVRRLSGGRCERYMVMEK